MKSRKSHAIQNDSKRAELENFIHSMATQQAEMHNLPFGDQSPAQMHDAMSTVRSAATTLLDLLHPVRAEPGSEYLTFPYRNWNLNMRLQGWHVMHTIIHQFNRKPKPETPFEDFHKYPNGLIENLRRLVEVLDLAIKDTAPKSGNSANRNALAIRKKLLAECAVNKHKELYGRLPASTRCGWLASVLSDAFENNGFLPANGDYWLRKAITKAKTLPIPPSASNRKTE